MAQRRRSSNRMKTRNNRRMRSNMNVKKKRRSRNRSQRGRGFFSRFNSRYNPYSKSNRDRRRRLKEFGLNNNENNRYIKRPLQNRFDRPVTEDDFSPFVRQQQDVDHMAEPNIQNANSIYGYIPGGRKRSKKTRKNTKRKTRRNRTRRNNRTRRR